MAKERVVVLVEELNTTKCHVQYSEILSAHPEDAREQWCHVCGCAVDRDGNAADNV
jgi:transposase